jgi:hypothetical protein
MWTLAHKEVMAMKKILLLILLALCVFLYSERSGTNRICYYDCGAAGTAAITISAVGICPLTI